MKKKSPSTDENTLLQTNMFRKVSELWKKTNTDEQVQAMEYSCKVAVNAIPENKSINIYFVACVLITPGFILGSHEEYTTKLALQQCNLAINRISNSDYVNNDKNIKEDCVAVTLDGTLGYYLTLGGFEAVCPVIDSDTKADTHFATSGVTVVHKLLAWETPKSVPITNFELVSKQGDEFLVTNKGYIIYKCKNRREFNRALQNPDTSKLINIPYKVTILPIKGDVRRG